MGNWLSKMGAGSAIFSLESIFKKTLNSHVIFIITLNDKFALIPDAIYPPLLVKNVLIVVIICLPFKVQFHLNVAMSGFKGFKCIYSAIKNYG